jgi:hypothetical protein
MKPPVPMLAAFAVVAALTVEGSPAFAGDGIALTEASSRLFACFDELAVEAQRRNWSELAYYRVLRSRCGREIDAFAAANRKPAADPEAARAGARITEQALRGALVDAALDYGRAMVFHRAGG